MMLFGLYSGQRLGDIATLRWNNIDLAHGELRFSTRKTEKTTIFLTFAGVFAIHDDQGGGTNSCPAQAPKENARTARRFLVTIL
jgi:integrase